MESNIYHIDHMTYRYNGETVLSVDRLDIKKSSITGFVGPNGSGKSTLLKLLGFITSPFSGKIFYREELAYPFSPKVRFNVTLLTQEPYLMRRSVFHNIAYGLGLKGVSKGLNERVGNALSLVGLEPEKFVHRKWFELSGGEAQRVALAARLILEPDVLILDEPTANVDAFSAQRIKAASFKARKEWGTTLLIASHDVEWLYGICDEVFNLFEGRVIGNMRCNILLGPFRKRADGNYENSPANGPPLIFPRPSHKRASAIIYSKDILLKKGDFEDKKDYFVHTGTIVRLSVEPFSHSAVATVAVGETHLTALYSAENDGYTQFVPGESVSVAYDAKSIQWV